MCVVRSASSLSLECDEGHKPLVVRHLVVTIAEIFAAKLRFDDAQSLYDSVVVLASANRDRDKPVPGSGFNEIDECVLISSVGRQ